MNTPTHSQNGANSSLSGLRKEVTNLKKFLMKIVDNYELPDELNTEIYNFEILPEENSPARVSGQQRLTLSEKKSKKDKFLNKYTANNNTKSNGDVSSNHDFLAAIPLSPKSASDCELSDLSSSYWSARISPRAEFATTHQKFSSRIPKLNLDDLPPDSDEEE